MKIQCLCGYIIADQTDSITYKAAFFADQDYEASYGKFISFIIDLLYAKDENTLPYFLNTEFGEEYPKDLSLEDIIADKLNGMLLAFGHTMYECNRCGRLWIRPDVVENKYVTYFPETSQRGILRSDREKDIE